MKKMITLGLLLSIISQYSFADINISVKVSDVAGRFDDKEILENLDKAIGIETGATVSLDRSDIKRFLDEADEVVTAIRGDKSKTEQQQDKLWDELRTSLTVPNLKANLKSKNNGILYGKLSKTGAHQFELVLSSGTRYFLSGYEVKKIK